MRDSDNIIGAVFLALSVVNLFLRDFLGFALLAAAGASLLIDAKRSRVAHVLQIVFGVTAMVLLIARIVVFFSR